MKNFLTWVFPNRGNLSMKWTLLQSSLLRILSEEALVLSGRLDQFPPQQLNNFVGDDGAYGVCTQIIVSFFEL